MEPRESVTCLWLLSAGVKHLCHHVLFFLSFFKVELVMDGLCKKMHPIPFTHVWKLDEIISQAEGRIVVAWLLGRGKAEEGWLVGRPVRSL